MRVVEKVFFTLFKVCPQKRKFFFFKEKSIKQNEHVKETTSKTIRYVTMGDQYGDDDSAHIEEAKKWRVIQNITPESASKFSAVLRNALSLVKLKACYLGKGEIPQYETSLIKSLDSKGYNAFAERMYKKLSAISDLSLEEIKEKFIKQNLGPEFQMSIHKEPSCSLIQNLLLHKELSTEKREFFCKFSAQSDHSINEQLNPLHIAVTFDRLTQQGGIDLIEKIITDRPYYLWQKSSSNFTPLEIAIKKNCSLEVIDFLLIAQKSHFSFTKHEIDNILSIAKSSSGEKGKIFQHLENFFFKKEK